MATELIPGLVAFLEANAALHAAASGVIVQDFLTDGASQGISFLLVSDMPERSFNGTGSHKMRVQFTCAAETATQQNAMAAALYDVLNGYRGQLPGGVYLKQVWFLTAVGGRSEASQQHSVTVDYSFYFNPLS